jgi:hypothetical protein
MMLETRNGVSRQNGAWRVIGTILAMDAAEIRTLADTVSELNDIERVNWYAIGHAKPTLDILMRSMGFRASFDAKGNMTLKKEADIGPLLTDEDDRVVTNPDLYAYVRNLAEAEWGPGVDLLVQQYYGLSDAGQFAQAQAMIDNDPRIAAYIRLEDEIFDRSRAAKAGPGSKTFKKFMADVASGKRTGYINTLMQDVMSGGSTMASAVGAAASRATSKTKRGPKSILYDLSVRVPVIHDVEPGGFAKRQAAMATARQPAPAQPQVDMTPWTNLVSSLQTSNSALLNQIRDYFDLSLYARQAHVKRNPDLARWLATTPPAELAKLERAFYAWSQQAGRLSSRQESRVSRTRPALANVLRVYKQRSTRAGI